MGSSKLVSDFRGCEKDLKFILRQGAFFPITSGKDQVDVEPRIKDSVSQDSCSVWFSDARIHEEIVVSSPNRHYLVTARLF